MSVAERKAWADAIFDELAQQRPVVEEAAAYLRDR